MKRWMTKKLGALVLTTATGLGVFSAGPAQGQDPGAQGNELQRRLGQLMERKSTVSPMSAYALDEDTRQMMRSEAFQQMPLKERMKMLRAQQAAKAATGETKSTHPLDHLRPASNTGAALKTAGSSNSLKIIGPKLAPGIQAPVSGQNPKVTSANVAARQPIITPKSDPAPPRPAIRPDAENPFEMPVIQAQGQPVVTPKSEPAAPTLAQELPADHEFQMPFTKDSAEEELAPEPMDYPVAGDRPQFEMPVKSAEANPFAESAPVAETTADTTSEPAPANAEPKLASGDRNPFADAQTKPAVHEAPATRRVQVLGLDGFCPVTLRDGRKLAKGNAQHNSTWEGVRYEFASARAKQMFDANPKAYAPVHAGCDVIQITHGGQHQAGSLKHACWYQRQLYLFKNEDAKRAFSANPEKYAQ